LLAQDICLAFSRALAKWEEDSRENRYDGYNDEQLNQGETTI